jgi:hypothetical protein
MRRRGLGATFALACLVGTVHAHAEERDAPDGAARFQAFLDREVVVRERQSAFSRGELSVGLILFGSGIGPLFFAYRDPIARAVAIGSFSALEVVGSALAFDGLAGMFAGPVERLDAALVRYRRSHDAATTLAWGEMELAHAAGRGRRNRMVFASAVGGIGIASVVTGIVAGFASGPDASLYLVLPGAAAILEGALLLALPSAPERAWRRWTASSATGVVAAPWIAPSRGGATAGVTLTF